MSITPKVKMVAGLLILIAGALIFAYTKLSLTFLIALAGYVIWRWGQNEQARLDKAREAAEDDRGKGKTQARPRQSSEGRETQTKTGAARKETPKSGAKKPVSKK